MVFVVLFLGEIKCLVFFMIVISLWNSFVEIGLEFIDVYIYMSRILCLKLFDINVGNIKLRVLVLF